MTELWEATFAEEQMMLGTEPSRSAVFARDYFARVGAKEILIPGIGYGRNAKPFLESGMSVTGIEISETAIGLARTGMGLHISRFTTAPWPTCRSALGGTTGCSRSGCSTFFTRPRGRSFFGTAFPLAP